MAQNRKNIIKKLSGMLGIAVLLLAVLSISLGFKDKGKITSGGRVRRYLIYVPDSYDPTSPTPLVISIHGFVQWPAHQRGMTGWNDLADEHGFLVVYPRGTGFPLRWTTRPTSDGPQTMAEELAFFSDLLDHLEGQYRIDPQRIYVNGMSNGGGMSDLLACKLSDRITAIGGVAGAYSFPREDCRPERPVPVIAFHGRQDQIVPFAGGASSRDEHYIFPGIEDWAAAWAAWNGCADSPLESNVTDHITRLVYQACREEAQVVLYRVDDGGHTWPGGVKLPYWIAGYTNQEINASALMWEFFQDYALER